MYKLVSALPVSPLCVMVSLPLSFWLRLLSDFIYTYKMFPWALLRFLSFDTMYEFGMINRQLEYR